jgi:hypothetical protein
LQRGKLDGKKNIADVLVQGLPDWLFVECLPQEGVEFMPGP